MTQNTFFHKVSQAHPPDGSMSIILPKSYTEAEKIVKGSIMSLNVLEVSTGDTVLLCRKERS